MKNAQLAQLAQLAFIALAAALVYAFVTVAQDGEARGACTPLCAIRPAYANHNRTAPDFDLPDLDGKRVRLSSFRGKTVVLNFWTKTCRPCLEEMPSLGDLRAVLGKDPTFPVLIDPDAALVHGKFGTSLYPETWFIDPDGTIRARVDGARDWTNPMVLNVVRMISRPSGCNLTFDRGKPRGDRRAICSDTVGLPEE
jgi:hypothetical protein